MVKELTAEYINEQADRALKAQYSRIRKVCREAKETGSTVPYRLGEMIDALVPVDTIRKVYRQGVE
jgi:hypothetical protein